MKTFTKISLLLLFVNFMFMNVLHSQTAGTLRIVASGSSTTAPFNDWLNGIGVPTQTYNITAADLSNLITNNGYKIALNYDTIKIDGNIVLNLPSPTANVYLTLQTNDYQNGVITFAQNSSLKIVAGNGKKSIVTLSAANLDEHIHITADTIRITDKNKDYHRIEMNGFKNWKQIQLDSLIDYATSIGYDIAYKPEGYKVNDFTYNTLFKVDSGVFSMTASADFLNGSGIGFKNMDREGKLTNLPLGAYPKDSFYVNLSTADGIRFKVAVNGSAEKVSIGISNCATAVFEYFVYDIPLTAVDKDGYMAIPISLFKKESWSNDWDLSKPVVFIIEIINITKNTKVSFSDMHAYRIKEKENGQIYLGNITADGYLDILSSDAISQRKNTSINAKAKTAIKAAGSIILPNENNVFKNELTLTSTYAYIVTDSNTTAGDSLHYVLKTIPNYSIANVSVDNESKGNVADIKIDTKNKHCLELNYTSANINIIIIGNNDICYYQSGKLTASGTADYYAWNYDGDIVSTTNQLEIPDSLALGTYRCFISAYRLYNNVKYTLTNSILITVHPLTVDSNDLIICYNELPFTWRDTIFDLETTSDNFVFYKSNYLGCDSTVYLTLTVLESYIENEAISICEKDLPYAWRDTVFDTETVSDTYVFYRNTINGCDSIVSLQLEIIKNIADNIGPIIGDTIYYLSGDYTYSIASVENADLYHWKVEEIDEYNESFVQLDTVSSDTFIMVNALEYYCYLISVRAINECDTSETASIKLFSTVNINEVNATKHIEIYPNPTSDYITIENKQGTIKTISIYDILGRKLKELPVDHSKITFYVGDLNKACYFIQIKTANEVMNSRFIKD